MLYKRKKLNLQVKRKFQMWLMVRIMGTILLSSFIAACILYFYARQEVSHSFLQAHIQIRHVSDLLLPVVLAGSFVSFLSGVAITIFLPQKIAGPIHRMECDLKVIEQGDLTKDVRLRSKDVLTDLACSINNTVASIRSKVQAMKLTQADLEKHISEDNKADIAKSLARHRESLDKLQT